MERRNLILYRKNLQTKGIFVLGEKLLHRHLDHAKPQRRRFHDFHVS
jgi:hypothetical protein